MLDKDNIISTSVLEAVEKIATDEKDYRKCSFMCFTLHHSHNALFPCLHSYSIQRADQYIANSRNCLPTRIHPVYLKKSRKSFYLKFAQKKVQ